MTPATMIYVFDSLLQTFFFEDVIKTYSLPFHRPDTTPSRYVKTSTIMST